MFNRVFKTLIFVTMMVGCTSHRIPAIKYDTEFDLELMRLSLGGVDWGIRQARYSLKLPRQRLDYQDTYFWAYILGPRLLTGQLNVAGATVERFSVYDLRSLLGTDVEGVKITGRINVSGWPKSVVLSFKGDGRVYRVALFGYGDGYTERAFYSHSPNRFKISKEHKPMAKVIVSVNKPVAGKKLVCYEDNEFGTFYYYLDR